MANLYRVTDSVIDTEGIYDTNEAKTQKEVNADVYDKRIMIMDIPVTITTAGEKVDTGLSVWEYGVLRVADYNVTNYAYYTFLTVSVGNTWQVRICGSDMTMDGRTFNHSLIMRVWYYKL